MAYCRSLQILEGVIIFFTNTIVIIVLLSEGCPIINGITGSNPLQMIILDDSEPGPVTLWDDMLGTLIIKIGQVHDVIIWHAEDVSDFNNTHLGKRSDQHMISWELKDIGNNMG